MDPFIVLGFFGVVVALALLLGSIFTVDTAQAAVLQKFGKFNRVATAGLGFKMPLAESIYRRVDLRMQSISVEVETKTKDNVFVTIPVTVQYLIAPDRIYDAVYKLADPKAQIVAFVSNVILGHVPNMSLDDAFVSQSQVSLDVTAELAKQMEPFGNFISRALVTDIVPPKDVVAAMNNINASQREQVAASAQGETKKILVIKAAEAEAASKKLQGEGIAAQRLAIVEGLRRSVDDLGSATGVAPATVLQTIMLTQFFDTLKEIGAQGKSNTIFIPHSPGAVGDFFLQMANAGLAVEKTTTAPDAAQAAAR